MAKIFGILLIVLCVWVGMEIYTKGMDHAFGGVLAGWSQPIKPQGSSWEQTPSDPGATGERGSLAQRVGSKVQDDLERGAERDDPDGDN